MLLITRALSFTTQHKCEWRFTFNGDESLCPRTLVVMTKLPVKFFLGDIRPMSEAQQHAVKELPTGKFILLPSFLLLPPMLQYIASFIVVYCAFFERLVLSVL